MLAAEGGDGVGDRDTAQTVAVIELVIPMLVTLMGIVTLTRPLQDSNAASPRVVTLLGIVTLVRLQYSNASLSDVGDAVSDGNVGEGRSSFERPVPDTGYWCPES